MIAGELGAAEPGRDGARWCAMIAVDLLGRYAAGRPLSPGYVGQLGWTLGAFGRVLGHVVKPADFTAENVNGYLVAEFERGLAPATRKNRRRMLLTLWAWLADEGEAPAPPRRRIAPAPRFDPVPHAWTPDEVRRLLAAAAGLPGSLASIPARAYWRAFVLVSWDSGLRGCDVRRLRVGDLCGCQVIRQVKAAGKPVLIRLRAETLASVRATFPPDRELLFPLGRSIHSWRRRAARLVARAQLAGGIGRLRSSTGTAAEIAAPGRGHEHLGNTREVFERHYLDRRLLSPDRPMPEEL